MKFTTINNLRRLVLFPRRLVSNFAFNEKTNNGPSEREKVRKSEIVVICLIFVIDFCEEEACNV
jgi:hypothetical protein